MMYLLGYLVCGMALTGFVLWRRWGIDHMPLIGKGEWPLAFFIVTAMTVTWPLWLYRALEMGL